MLATLAPSTSWASCWWRGWALGKPKLSAGQLIELARDAEVLVTSYDEVTDAVMAACPRLQVIACTRANPVNIDTQAAQARGIRVLYTPGRNADAAAELTLGLMLSLARHIPQSHAALKRGEFTQADNAAAATQQGLRRDVVWDVSPESPYEVFKGTELRNKTLGLVGYGNIGRRVARIARAFGMAVLVVDPFVAAEDINEPGLQKTTPGGAVPRGGYRQPAPEQRAAQRRAGECRAVKQHEARRAADQYLSRGGGRRGSAD